MRPWGASTSGAVQRRLPTAAPLLACLSLLLLPRALAARPLTLEEALTLGLERGPRLLVARAEVAAARARLAGAWLLVQDNPEVQGSLGPRVRGGDSRLEAGLEVGLPLEVSGQRAARRALARAELSSREAQLESQRVALAAEVRAKVILDGRHSGAAEGRARNPLAGATP